MSVKVTTDCPNGPDEYGNWPCDPLDNHDGTATCHECGRTANWPASPAAPETGRARAEALERGLEQLRWMAQWAGIERKRYGHERPATFLAPIQPDEAAALLAALRDADADRDKLERALGEARDEAFGLRGRAVAAEARLRRVAAPADEERA